MKYRLILVALVIITTITIYNVSAAQPCTGRVYADHPALAAECRHNYQVRHDTEPKRSNDYIGGGGGFCSVDDNCSLLQIPPLVIIPPSQPTLPPVSPPDPYPAPPPVMPPYP